MHARVLMCAYVRECAHACVCVDTCAVVCVCVCVRTHVVGAFLLDAAQWFMASLDFWTWRRKAAAGPNARGTKPRDANKTVK